MTDLLLWFLFLVGVIVAWGAGYTKGYATGYSEARRVGTANLKQVVTAVNASE